MRDTLPLCCKINPIFRCALCNQQVCDDHYSTIKPEDRHYNPLYWYRCPENPQRSVALINSDGKEYLRSNFASMYPCTLVPFDPSKHEVELPRRDD